MAFFTSAKVSACWLQICIQRPGKSAPARTAWPPAQIKIPKDPAYGSQYWRKFGCRSAVKMVEVSHAALSPGRRRGGGGLIVYTWACHIAISEDLSFAYSPSWPLTGAIRRARRKQRATKERPEPAEGQGSSKSHQVIEAENGQGRRS